MKKRERSKRGQREGEAGRELEGREMDEVMREAI